MTLNMGSEPQLPVRMGAEHSLTLRMDDEPPLPGKLQEDLRRCTTMQEMQEMRENATRFARNARKNRVNLCNDARNARNVCAGMREDGRKCNEYTCNFPGNPHRVVLPVRMGAEHLLSATKCHGL